MTRRERLLATLAGKPVDRTPVSFYEIGGWKADPDDPDPWNIYNGPGWRELVDLAESHSDIMRFAGPIQHAHPDNARSEFFSSESWEKSDSKYNKTTLRVAGRTMESVSRHDRGVNTTWSIEHLLKDVDDIKAYLQLPGEVFLQGDIDVCNLVEEERRLGDAGVLLLDQGDPICAVAPLFSMADYTVVAFTEPRLFHDLMEQAAPAIIGRAEKLAVAFPGRLWRVVGSEYASEPYLPPRLYREFLYNYTKPICDAIRRHGGYPRIHSHGRLRGILDMMIDMGAGLDPCEPPPQGDMELAEIRAAAPGLTLFGNIESSDIENLDASKFEAKVRRAMDDGPDANGSRFVLMPSACPYGREITELTMTNYETMVRVVNE
ncbi:MAG: uroporphyrinogen decarboxylase family protein [bacterium]